MVPDYPRPGPAIRRPGHERVSTGRSAQRTVAGVNVDVTPLPGIGVRKEIELRNGRRVGVIAHRDGKVDLILSRADDPDACVAELPLTTEEAGALANLLGAPQLVNQLKDEHADVPGITTRKMPIKLNSPFDGRPLGDTALRTRTQVSVVAIMRAGQVIPSPTPAHVLAAGDIVIAVGTAEKLEQAADILAHG